MFSFWWFFFSFVFDWHIVKCTFGWYWDVLMPLYNV
jgi:hypothetical protein